MHVDMAMLLLALAAAVVMVVMVVVAVCGAAPGGCKHCGRTCGKMFESRGREREERGVRRTGECGFDLAEYVTASTFPFS